MKIEAIRSDALYRKMANASEEEKERIFCQELLKPFEPKYSCLGIPLKASEPGGYDAVMASVMGGSYAPAQITGERMPEIEKISRDTLWEACLSSISGALEGFEEHGIRIQVQNYLFTILLNDPQSPMTAFTGDCCGDGGIPGYILGTIIPNDRSLEMLPVTLAHETNHNVRWQFMQWSPQITLGDMIVSEGLAESFATFRFGEDKAGIWVTGTDEKTLNTIVKPMIRHNLEENDFQKASAFLYGDGIMTMRGGAPTGMPTCGGYACGYWLIQHYLKKTGRSIYEATITKTEEILKETEDFWK